MARTDLVSPNAQHGRPWIFSRSTGELPRHKPSAFFAAGLGIPRSRSRSTFRLVHGRPVLLAHSARARSAWLLCPHGRPSDSARLTVAPILDRQHRDVSDRPWQVTVDLRFSPRWTVGQSHPGQTFAQPDAHMLRSTFTILQGGPVPPQIFCLGHMQPTVNRWKNSRLTDELFFTHFLLFAPILTLHLQNSHILAPTKIHTFISHLKTK